MSWIAISDEHTSHINPRFAECEAEHLLEKGSFVVETNLSPEGRPQVLFHFKDHHPWERSLSLRAVPGGGIILVQSQADEVHHVALNIDARERADVIRITYSWNAPARQSSLTIELPETEASLTVNAGKPWPILYRDIKGMTERASSLELDSDVVFFAFSDEIEPIGPMPRLAGSVPVVVNGEYRPISKVQPGDLVQTLEQGNVPVLARITRNVPARGSFRPVRLRAPYFGLQSDIIVAPDQKLVVSQPTVEYLFGRESVLVPARHLVNGTSAIWHDAALTVTYHQLVLPDHETIMAAGAPVESLFIGRIRRKPKQHGASLLRPYARDCLPEHLLSSHPVLRPFEAITLVEQCAA